MVKFQEKAKDPKFDRYYSQNRNMLAADRVQVWVVHVANTATPILQPGISNSLGGVGNGEPPTASPAGGHRTPLSCLPQGHATPRARMCKEPVATCVAEGGGCVFAANNDAAGS